LIVADNPNSESKEDPGSNSDTSPAIMDLTQDSDDENLKAKKKTRGKRVDAMDVVEEYFHKPVLSKGQVCISVPDSFSNAMS
jgi:hypothetical protein